METYEIIEKLARAVYNHKKDSKFLHIVTHEHEKEIKSLKRIILVQGFTIMVIAVSLLVRELLK